MMVEAKKHIPVMLNEVLQALNPQKGKVYVDATFGNGGYSQALLNAADCTVIALDRDPTVVPRAHEFEQMYGKRFIFHTGCFSNLSAFINQPVDGFVFDIGVSSMQLDQSGRGFSFSKAAPLDMRMSCCGLSAADIVNGLEEKELADLIFQYGEEKNSRRIARKILEFRQKKPIETTSELAEIIYTVNHKTFKGIDPATRTFQALRIAVNDELGELNAGIETAISLLKPEGILVVVDFHSLEDRIVKNLFNRYAGKNNGTSRYLPLMPENNSPLLKKVSKAIMPTEDECKANPRSRSAKLRYAVKADLADLQNNPSLNAETNFKAPSQSLCLDKISGIAQPRLKPALPRSKK